ncbi:hypothetical protein Tco_0146712 [Tanacetum coccineum]
MGCLPQSDLFCSPGHELDSIPAFIGPWGKSGDPGLPIVVRPLQNLGYSEWSTPAGLKLAQENLQSRVKEEDSITDVENAAFDLGVMDSLCRSKNFRRHDHEVH